MTDDSIKPKPDTPWTFEQQALDLKARMQALQNEVAALLDELAAAGLIVNIAVAGPPVLPKHQITVDIIKKF
jgi:hypothetical protein